jgi:hypothetical protein
MEFVFFMKRPRQHFRRTDSVEQSTSGTKVTSFTVLTNFVDKSNSHKTGPSHLGAASSRSKLTAVSEKIACCLYPSPCRLNVGRVAG